MQTNTAQSDLNFDLGEQKELLRQEIRKLVARECPREYVREMDEKEEFPRHVWDKLAEAGYLGIPIDQRYGGSGGDILDPESGSVYRCKMHLEQDGSRLVLRGYIGFSLLGRSQTWQRQS